MDFSQLREQFAGETVLVYGDQYLDWQGIGGWQGYSREEEGIPIFRMSREFYNPGGAGNLAANFRALGLRTIVAGVWGNGSDWNRKILEAEFHARGIVTDGMVVGSGTPKFMKGYFQSGAHGPRLDLDPKPLPAGVQEACCVKLKELVAQGQFDFLAVADYYESQAPSQQLTGACFPQILSIIATCKKPKFGTSRSRITSFMGFDSLFLNRTELIEQVGDIDMTLNLRAAFLLSITNTKSLVLTLSGQGAEVFTCPDVAMPLNQSRPLNSLPVHSQEVTESVDPCGCGDTFFATYTAVKSVGYEDLEAARLANAAARVVAVKKYGASTPTFSELEIEYQRMYGTN